LGISVDVPLSQVKVQLVDANNSHPAKCKQIIFPKGSVSTSVNGVVGGFTKEQENIPTNCYKITTGNNQTAKISITSTSKNSGVEVVNTKNNNILSHDGGDDNLEFLTKKTTYKINVSQFMPSGPDDDSYSLSVEIR
jgi:hypothetical protein